MKKGDAVSKNVAAASIVAKVTRDAAMRRYHRKLPGLRVRQQCRLRDPGALGRPPGARPLRVHRRSFFGVLGFPDEDGVFRPHPARDLEDRIAWITDSRRSIV